MKCEDQIIQQLQNQNVQFSESMLIENRDNLTLSLDLSDCYSDRKFEIRNIKYLKITKLNLSRINNTQKLLSIINIDKIYIESINMSNEIDNQKTDSFEILDTNKYTEDNFYRENSELIQIDVNENIEVDKLIMNSSGIFNLISKNNLTIGDFQSINSSFNILTNYSLIKYLKLDDYKYSNINGSSVIHIKQLDYCCLQNINSPNIIVDKFISNQNNSISNRLTQNLIINSLEMKFQNISNEYSEFTIQNISKVELNNFNMLNTQNFSFIRINMLSINNFQITTKTSDRFYYFWLEQIDQVVINELNIFDFVQSSGYFYALYNFYNITDVLIKNLNVKNIIYQQMFVLNDINNIIIKDVILDQLSDFPLSSFFSLYSFNQLNISNMTVTKYFHSGFNSQYQYSNREIKENMNYYVDLRSIVSIWQHNFFDSLSLRTNHIIVFDGIIADFNGQNGNFLFLGLSNKERFNLEIQNSHFRNMYHIANGGCMVLKYNQYYNTTIIIQNSTFFNCSSLLYGGAIYTSGITDLNNVSIENCKSKFGGAIAISNYDDLKNFKKIKFTNNSANYFHKDIFINWRYINLNETYEYSQINENQILQLIKANISSLSSYILIPGIVYLLSLSLITIKYPIQNEQIEYIHFQSNDALFQNMFYYLDKSYPNYMVQETNQKNTTFPYLVIKANSILQKTQIMHFYYPNTSFSFDFQVNSGCVQGQQKTYVGDDILECQYCPFTQASYNNESCTQCNTQQFDYCYSNVSFLKEGYYRRYLTIQEIYYCQYNPNSCIGGKEYGDDSCADGFVGIECKSCDILGKKNKTYGTKKLYQCVQCSEIRHNILVSIIVYIAFIFFTFLIINNNTKYMKRLVYQDYLSKMNIIYIGQSFRKLGYTSIYVKNFSFVSSLLYFIQTQMNFQLKNSFLDLTIQFQSPLSEGYVSLDCVITDIFGTNINYPLIKLLFFFILPIISIPLIIGLQIIKQNFFKKENLIIFNNTKILTVIYLNFIVFYNSIFSVVLDIILCREFRYGQRKSMIDLQTDCGELTKVYSLGYFGVYIYCSCVPLIILKYLLENKDKLNNFKTLFQLGFLYKEYKEKLYYWELVRFFVRFSLILASKALIYNFEFMNCINLMILLVYLLMLFKLEPFKRQIFNKMEQFSIMILSLNFISLVLFSSQQQQEYSEDSQKKFANFILIFAQLLSIIYIFFLFIMIIINFLDSLLIKSQKYSFLQRIFYCQYCQRKKLKQKRTLVNLKKFRHVVFQIQKRLNTDPEKIRLK